MRRRVEGELHCVAGGGPPQHAVPRGEEQTLARPGGGGGQEAGNGWREKEGRGEETEEGRVWEKEGEAKCTTVHVKQVHAANITHTLIHLRGGTGQWRWLSARIQQWTAMGYKPCKHAWWGDDLPSSPPLPLP